MTSELNERRWAVLSERGREAAGLSYADAAGLVARLRGEGVRGLCVVTDEAASHINEAKRAAAKSAAGGGGSGGAPAGPKPRRGAKRKAS